MVFLGLIFFLFIPSMSKGKLRFIDVFLFFCLYFDAAIVFAGPLTANFTYTQSIIVLLYSINYFAGKTNKLNVMENRIMFPVIGFLSVVLLVPILKGADANETARSFALTSSSLLILPLAFHHYSTRGDIRNLIKAGGYFIISWVIIVLIFTALRVDTLSGNVGSDSFGLGIFYYGDMSRRGAISYMGIAILLLPLILPLFKSTNKTVLILSSVFVGVLLLVSMKRFALIAIVLGMVNYIISSKLKIGRKIGLIASAALVIIPVFLFTNIESLVIKSYYKRGAERKISVVAMQEDLRFYEPLYILKYSAGAGVLGVLLGRDTVAKMDIETDKYFIADRKIHNQYGAYMLLYGVLGLILYLMIYTRIYMLTRKFKKLLSNLHRIDYQYWIVFQNIVVIFVLGGIGGGHIHVTYRSMVLLFAGGISGHFYKLLTKTNQNPLPQASV